MRALCCFLVLVALVVPKQSDAQITPKADWSWWKTAVLYQIYPRSFKDSDGDGVGDLNGITEKLDHLKDIGVTGVWMSPIFRSPMADFGYDISDFRDIDPLFGTLGDFDKLVAKAKSLGIKVILDFVPNHTSDEHDWFIQSVKRVGKYSDYYVWHDGRWNGTDIIPPNNWQSIFGGPAWTWNRERGQFYLHQFVSKQPDLNYNNTHVVEEIKDVLRFWLNKGADGYRVDAIPHLFEGPIDDRPDYEMFAPKHLPETYDMVVQWRKIMDEESKNDSKTRVLMTEAYGSLDEVLAYYGTPVAPAAHFSFNFQLITDVHFNYPPASSAEDISGILNTYLGVMTDGQVPNWVLGNHDQHRVASRFVPELVDGMNMIAQLLPGVAVTYNGEEIGMENTYITWEQCVDPQGLNAGPCCYLEVTRDLERTPFQWDDSTSAGFSNNNTTWLPVNENYKVLNLAAQKLVEKSHYNVYKKLTSLRKEPAFQRGETKVVALTKQILAFTRSLSCEDWYLVVVNFDNKTEVIDLTNSTLTGVPPFLSIEIVSINSDHMIGELLSPSVLEVGPFEAFVFSPSPGFASIIVQS